VLGGDDLAEVPGFASSTALRSGHHRESKTLLSTVLRRADRCSRKPVLKPKAAIHINNKNQYSVNSN
jgi:hypothetical protein